MSLSEAHHFTIRDSTLNSVAGNQYNNIVSGATNIRVLSEAAVHGAAYDSAERYPPSRCAPGTRQAVVAKINTWMDGGGNQAILWMNGPAGYGKSTIAQTVAELCAKRGTLAGSFFFSRGHGERGGSERLISTLAYQLAVSVPSVRNAILAALEYDPAVLSRAPSVQLKTLIIDPLRHLQPPASTPFVFVIDGLDECGDPDAAANILLVFADAVRSHPQTPLQVVITSRPEARIQAAIRMPQVRTLTDTLALADEAADGDIRTYLTTRFSEIYDKYYDILFDHPEPWPAPQDIERIVRNSAGLFIYAATVANFVDNPNEHPATGLAIVLVPQNNTSTTPYKALDDLYRQVLTASPYTPTVSAVLGAVLLLHRRHTPPELAPLLGYDVGAVRLALRGLHSLLRIPPRDGPVHALHASLRDFLTDARRAGALYLDPAAHHTRLARGCLRIIRAARPADFAEPPRAYSDACAYLGWHVGRADTSDAELLAELGGLAACFSFEEAGDGDGRPSVAGPAPIGLTLLMVALGDAVSALVRSGNARVMSLLEPETSTQ